MTNILRWWLIVSVTLIGIVSTNYFDGFSFIYERDSTKLSFLILFIFAISTSFIGFKLILQQRGGNHSKNYESQWFLADLCTQIGLAGTLLGFIMVLLGTFDNLTLADPASVQNAISAMALVLLPAMLTSLTGIVCSMLIRSQQIVAEGRK